MRAIEVLAAMAWSPDGLTCSCDVCKTLRTIFPDPDAQVVEQPERSGDESMSVADRYMTHAGWGRTAGGPTPDPGAGEEEK